MNLDLHQNILARLETIKAEGIIADYWVSWVGTGGKLVPGSADVGYGYRCSPGCPSTNI
jgi:hypothetical protein